MKIKIFAIYILFSFFLSGCYKDEGNYNYIESTKIEFLNMQSITCKAEEEFEIEAPIKFSLSKNQEEKDDFEIEWYLNDTKIGSGAKLKYTLDRTGSYKLILKVINKATGERYISKAYGIEAKSGFGWGWMILSERENQKSSLSFLNPEMKLYSKIEDKYLDGNLGKGPTKIGYYFLLGSIPGSNINGIPKILINQNSGSVTLDGNSLRKDMLFKDEFINGTEPPKLEINAFAAKIEYYAFCTDDGKVYMKGVGYANKHIPYYNKYPAEAYDFNGGAKITCFQSFSNVYYRCFDEKVCMMFDEQNSRFIAICEQSSFGEESYEPDVVYLSNYDSDYEGSPEVARVDNMGDGTKCLGIGAYEKVDIDPEYHSVTRWGKYVSLINMNNQYYIHTFSMKSLSEKNHLITNSEQWRFSGNDVLNTNSLVKISSNFEAYPYLFFTNGEGEIYVYSMNTKSHKLLYNANSKITNLCPSPIVCEFADYGGNSRIANFRLAISKENNEIDIIDVRPETITKIFEGLPVKEINLGSFKGFGTIKDVTWCTNYLAEY